MSISRYSGFFAISVARGLGAFAIFFLNYVVVQLLPGADAGLFLWAFSALMIAIQVFMLGFHDVVLKYVAQSNTVDTRKTAFVISNVLARVVISSLIGSWLFYRVLLYFLGEKLADVTLDNQTAYYISLSLFPAIVVNICAFSLQGLGRGIASVLVLSVMPYLLFSMFSPLTSYHAGDFAKVLFSSYFIVMVVALFILKDYLRPRAIVFDRNETSYLWSMSLPMWAIAMSAVVIQWGGATLSGVWLAPEDIAVFSVAIRIAAVVNFFLIVINFIAAPKISVLYREGKLDELQKMVFAWCGCAQVLSLILVVFIIAYAVDILALFNEDYAKYSAVVCVLSIGQAINLATGPVGYLLTMTGHERVLRSIYAVTAVFCVSAVAIFTPIFGLFGAACAVSISVAVQNLVAAFFVWKKIRISVVPFQ